MATEDRTSSCTTSEREDCGDGHEHTGRLKRKSPASSPRNDEESASKRQKRDDSKSPAPYDRRRYRDPHSPPQRDLSPPRPSAYERRKQISQEEKKRGQRLFGGLLSTLSQRSTNTHQRKRQEIEKRQQERARQQKAENEKHRSERLAKVKSIRAAQNFKLEEDMMRFRHRNTLAMARYLKTNAEPPIYYLPYRLTDEQKDVIDDEIRKAEATVDSEVESFRQRKMERLNIANLGRLPKQPPTPGTSPAGETQKPNSDVPTDATNDELRGQRSTEAKPKSSAHADDSVDVMVEAEEDTVIY